MAEQGGRTREQAADDALLTRIGQTVMLHRGGDREEARNRFTLLWEEIGEHGDPLHRCTLAHYMADTRDDPAEELEWDLRALSAADSVPPGTEPAGSGTAGPGARPGSRWQRAARPVRSLYPSLYLNVAADYAKLGRADEARAALGLARAATPALGDDGYSEGVRAAIGRLELRLQP